MENKTILTAVLCLIAGLSIGYLVWGNYSRMYNMMNAGSYQMQNRMMTNGGVNMSEMMSVLNENLAGKTGGAFDKAFIEEMTIHHQGAIAMAKLALANSKRQEIKDLANAIISAQTAEINQMKQWSASWFK